MKPKMLTLIDTRGDTYLAFRLPEPKRIKKRDKTSQACA
jgi:hypothetical protein